jgi:hypothetical protein
MIGTVTVLPGMTVCDAMLIVVPVDIGTYVPVTIVVFPAVTETVCEDGVTYPATGPKDTV